VLAGDYLKTACDLDVPLIGVGLLYQQGYFRQALNANGEQIEFYPYNDPTMLPVVPLRDDHGEWVRISIELPGRSLHLRSWRAQVGRRSLLLLDSNDPLNDPGDRGITSELYGGGKAAGDCWKPWVFTVLFVTSTKATPLSPYWSGRVITCSV